MEMFEVKIMPPTEILTVSRNLRYACFMEYGYNSADELPFIFDEQTETLYISERVPKPQKVTGTISRMVNRRYNGSKAQDRDYELLGSMFDDRVFLVAFDMFKHYFRKRAVEKKRKAVMS